MLERMGLMEKDKKEEREKTERERERGRGQCGLFITVNPDTVAFPAHMDWIRGYAGRSSTV